MPEAALLTPDGVLIRQIAGGDAAAAEQLYSRHAISLYALAYGVLMDRTDADLVVEGTFAQVTHRAAEFDSDSGAHVWLSGMARTHARALAHRRRSDPALSLQLVLPLPID